MIHEPPREFALDAGVHDAAVVVRPLLRAVAAHALRVAEALADGRTELKYGIVVLALAVDERERMAEFEVHVGAVVRHQVALDRERRLYPEDAVGKAELEVEVLRVAHVTVVTLDVLVHVVEVNGELAELLAQLELMRNAHGGVERRPAARAVTIAAALAVALRHVED